MKCIFVRIHWIIPIESSPGLSNPNKFGPLSLSNIAWNPRICDFAGVSAVSQSDN